MRRRDILTAALTAAALPLSARAEKLVAPVTRAARRVRPGEAGWPSSAEWQTLKQAVGGNLLDVHPLFAVCEADPKGPACQDVVKQSSNPFYIGDQPAGTQVSGWLDAWTSAASAYAVKARKRRRRGGGEFRAHTQSAPRREGRRA